MELTGRLPYQQLNKAEGEEKSISAPADNKSSKASVLRDNNSSSSNSPNNSRPNSRGRMNLVGSNSVQPFSIVPGDDSSGNTAAIYGNPPKNAWENNFRTSTRDAGLRGSTSR